MRFDRCVVEKQLSTTVNLLTPTQEKVFCLIPTNVASRSRDRRNPFQISKYLRNVNADSNPN
jgi:hypothetical protein